MENTLDDKCRRLEKEISWSKKMVNTFAYTDGYPYVLENLQTYLEKHFENKTNDEGETLIKEVKVIDLSYFDPDTYFENHKKLLNEVENNLYIIDCREVKTQKNNKTFGQMSSFYYMAKEKKTSFIYLFKSEDIRDYAVVIEPYQMRTSVMGEIDNDLKIYRLYKEMSEKYINKDIKEKKNKI